MKNMQIKALVFLLALAFALPAAAQNYNTRYGETRFGSLPEKGAVSKTVWVGQWWSYGKSGIAYRQNATGDMQTSSSWSSYPQNWKNAERINELSAAEKYDLLIGLAEKIEREKIVESLQKVAEKEITVTEQIEERRELIRLLNKAIEENKSNPSFDWRETDDGKKYLELTKEIEAAEKEIEDLKPELDTATEWEIWNHGEGQFGVQSWWGHCNAWAAAAIMEPEPRFEQTIAAGDQELKITAGDVKALLTEVWMEHSSSFHGSRNEYHKDDKGREGIDYQDVTPAAMHIYFADQIGNKDRSFVIDRFTGSEVWNQPVKAYWIKYDVLNGGEPVTRDIKVTKYPGYSSNVVESLGEREVYEVSVSTTIHWMTDGVQWEELTDEGYSIDGLTWDSFSDEHTIHNMSSKQVEQRTLNYTLWLTAAPDDPNAEILGDGEWNNGHLTGYEHLHPDFMWQPQTNVNNQRDYENPYLDYDYIVEKILPGSLKPADDPNVEPVTGFVFEGTAAIPDADFETGVDVAIEVKDSGITEIGEMAVHVVIEHTYIGDLEITLKSADGRTATLKAAGVGGSADNIDQTYDVKDFDGMPADGTWTVNVRDKWQDDTGSVTKVDLSFK